VSEVSEARVGSVRSVCLKHLNRGDITDRSFMWYRGGVQWLMKSTVEELHPMQTMYSGPLGIDRLALTQIIAFTGEYVIAEYE